MSEISKFIYDELPPRLQEEVDKKGFEKIDALFEGLSIEESECLKSNLLANMPIANTRGIDLNRYVNSVKYVSLVLTGSTPSAAYKSVYPDRIAEWKAMGKDEAYIAKAIKRYDKTCRTVNKIRDRLLVPVHVMYQSGYHLAIEAQLRILTKGDAKEGNIIKAADSLMTHLKPPEVGREHLDEVTEQRQDKFLETLRSVTDSLAIAQQQAIMNKTMTTQEIAERGLETIEGELIERD